MTILDDPSRYTVGWIAVLPIERAAAIALLDDVHEPPSGFEQHQSDANSYTWGRVGKHDLVIASLPAGVYGTTSAAATAMNLLSSLPQIRVGLLVGIGGAIARPDRGRDIRLGDIVVSQPHGTAGGVIQYDLGKAQSNQAWERKGSLNKPPPILLNALASLQAQHEIKPSIIPNLLQAMWAAHPYMTKPRNKLPAFVHQGSDNDRLFKAEHEHAGGSTCAKCDVSWEVTRDKRDTIDPEIHYGVIASGNTLVKNATDRDKIAGLAGEDCICFEMEAAGIMDRFPCLVIRGISDYADSHKNDRWQRYASATAAAYAKELLDHMPVNQLQASHRAVDLLGSISEGISSLSAAATRLQNSVQSIQTFVCDSNQREVLAHLEEQIAAGAHFDSAAEQHNSRCLLNTRVELLQRISEWAANSNAEAVFWLNGMAGTGKSTISRTVAESVAREGQLGASFFFKRGETDRGTMAKFFLTIAADLTRRDPTIAHLVKEAIENDPTILRKAMREQFDKLILRPLSLIQRKEPIVIVVDALDECDEEDNVKLMIYLFSQAKTLNSVQLKVLVTSRPDLPPRLGFKAIEGKYHDLILHEIPKLVIEHDISLFIENELSQIRDDYNKTVSGDRQLSKDWPTRSDISILVQMAIPLFIYAATVCRFIGDRRLGTPDRQLKKIFQPRPRHHLSKLGSTYLPVLDNLIVDASAEQYAETLRQFRYIVGSIVVLASPLSTTALARMLDLPRDDIDGKLDMLNSVLSVPSSPHEPVRLLHLSFRDFLLQTTAANEFWVDEAQTHKAMASNCLRVMDCLREDICQLGAPGTHRLSVDPQKTKTFLPPELQYACLYWVYHMQGAGSHDGESERVYSFLKRCFLHWMEVLSLIGRARESLRLVKTLQSVYKDRGSNELREFLYDAERFILANISTIDNTPLQLYSSLLVFAPESSIVRTTFSNQLPDWIRLKPRVDRNWSQTLQTLEGHGGSVSSAAFSPNGTLIASASEDKTVRLWRVDTGACVQTFEGHSSYISSAAFSPNSMLIASASKDMTVRLWHANIGKCVQIFKGHSDYISSAAFSPDSTLIASASSDRTVRLWRANTGKCIQILNGHHNYVSSVAFSPNSMLIASASRDKTVRLWRADIGECVQIFEGHSDYVNSVAFSPDSMLIASASWDRTVQLWRVDTGECLQTFEGYRGYGGYVTSVAFSPNGILIAAATSDRIVRLWHANTGECVQMFKDHSSIVNSVAFSPDGTLIASASDDKTVRLWRIDIGARVQTFEGHSDYVRSVAFSPNNTLIASASFDGTVRLWRADTGECVQTFEAHGGSYTSSAAFSPDGTLIASVSDEEIVRLWRINKGAYVQMFKGYSDCVIGIPVQTFSGHSGYISSAPFSPDGTLIASASDDGTVRLWRVDTGACVLTSEDHGDYIISMPIQTFDGHGHCVSPAAFSPDGTLIALPCHDGTVRLWRVDIGVCVQTFEGHSRCANSAAFSPDGTLIASASDDGTVRLWRVDMGVCVQIFAGHGSYVNSAAFSPNSTLITSASDDGTVRLWRVDTGACVQTFEGIISHNISFDPNGKRLHTDAGAIILRRTIDADSSANLEHSTMAVSHPDVGISQDSCWLTWNGEETLWLPKDFRPSCSAVLGNTVVIGNDSGRVIVMRFA